MLESHGVPTMVAFRRQTSQHKRYTTGSVSVNNAAARASTKALARPSRATSLEEGDPGSCGTHLFRCGLPHTSTPLFAGGEGTRVRFAQKAPLSNCLSMTSRCVVSSIGSRDLDAAVLLPPSPMILDRRDALSLFMRSLRHNTATFTDAGALSAYHAGAS